MAYLDYPGIDRVPPQQDRILPALVINLDRSKDRWKNIAATSDASGLRLLRVAAIEGADIAPQDRLDVDRARFEKYNGREILDGEYGCYRSHLRALQIVVDNAMPLAMIVEDDVEFAPGLKDRVFAIFDSVSGISVLKLTSHRTKGFVRYATSRRGDDIGRCVHGPQGSAACYVVTLQGARELLEALSVMWLPYDVALERGWANSTRIFSTREPVLNFADGHQRNTTIGNRQQYRNTKFSLMRRISTLAFRIRDYMARAAYASHP